MFTGRVNHFGYIAPMTLIFYIMLNYYIMLHYVVTVCFITFCDDLFYLILTDSLSSLLALGRNR